MTTPAPNTSEQSSSSTLSSASEGSSTESSTGSSTSDVSSESSVTEVPEELTTIIEIEEPVEGNGTDAFDFVNLPGYGVVDDGNSTLNASVFSCFNRRYGYYADIPKKCLMFHLCYPIQEPTTGQILFQRFSFVCSDNAIFDQQHLVCVDNETLSYACTESEKFYISSNDKLIEQMQQQQAQQYLQQQQQGQQYLQQGQNEQQIVPQQLTQAQMIQLQQHLQQQAAQAQAEQNQNQNQRQDPATLAAAEAAYREYARQLTAAASGESDNNSTEIDAAQQYAILEQLFG